MDVECDNVMAFVEKIIHCDILDESFSGFIKNNSDFELSTTKTLEANVIDLFKSFSSNLIEDATKKYISITSKIINYNQSEILFSMLEIVIQSELIIAKDVCCCILSSNNFEFQNEVFWVNGLNFIRRIIYLVNYKGVRDILAILLSKIPLIPLKSSISICKQINSLHNLIQYIFERDSALLPAYFVLDEIQKKAFVWQNGHWNFSKMISAFIDSFRPVAKMVSISGRPKILPIVGYSLSINSLKLDHTTAKYKLKGLLPYDKELNEPQDKLLLYVVEQNHSKESIVNMLSLNKVKGRNVIIEKLLIELIISSITKSGHLADNYHHQKTDNDNELNQIKYLWQHISTTLLYFEFFYQNINFSSFNSDLYSKIYNYNSFNVLDKVLLKSREFVMWTLLQMLSGCIQKNSFEIFNPIFNFFDFYYNEKDPIPLPDLTEPNCVFKMSAASVWILLSKKAENDSINFQRTVPRALRAHVDFLNELINKNSFNSPNDDYLIVLLCNSYSTSNECYSKTFRLFVENILGNCGQNSSTVQSNLPVSMDILDSLTVHTKINLVTHIMNQFLNLAQTSSSHCLSSGLVETYGRLLVYSEIETFGIKAFINQLLSTVLRNHCWNYLYTLLELFSYRLHHVNCAYRIQLLRQLYTKSNISQINHSQLYLGIENTALKIILGFNSAEFLSLSALIQPRVTAEFLPSDSEELNKIFVLTLARAIHITGSETLSATWVNEVLSDIKQNLNTQLSWPVSTLQCFPSVISEFYQSSSKFKESNNEQLIQSVCEEYRKWKSMTNEGDMVKHFTSQSTPPYFYCLLYKMLLDKEPINVVAYKILDRIGVRALSIHLRTFADYLVYQFANLVGGNDVTIYLEALNDLIWKFHVMTLDRLLLCLSLCSFEGNEAQVCFFIIQLLIFKNSEFKSRVMDFVRDNSPEHWKQSNWSEKQNSFQQQHPEKFYFEHLQDIVGQGSPATYLPVLFSNLCLRVLPVFDIILHRLIEFPSSSRMSFQLFDQLLDGYGCLYKFHEQPITFLYNTLHYYEVNLREKHQLKRKLVYTIINSFKDIRPRNWSMSETFLNFGLKNEDQWNTNVEYFKQLIGRLVDTLSNQSKSINCPFPSIDFRFNEFPNSTSHALYVTCVEILALPGNPSDISNSIINVLLHHHKYFPRKDIELWINAIALILISLPESFSNIINERILDLLKKPQSISDKNMFNLFDFQNSHLHLNELEMSYLIALSHAYWSHASVGLICSLPQFIKEKIKPIIKCEEQFIFVCYLFGPFLHRFSIERTRCVMDITIELYEMLEIIDKKCQKLKHIDIICDLLYHIKYMFTGDHIKKEIEGRILNMRPELQKKLRFISNITISTEEF